MAVAPKPQKKIAFTKHPAAGGATGENMVEVSAVNVQLVRFWIVDAKGALIGRTADVKVFGGKASRTFFNPPKAGRYFARAQDAAQTHQVVTSKSFDVTAGTKPVPSPDPKPEVPPGPVAPEIVAVEGDFAAAAAGKTVAITVRAKGATSIQWVHVGPEPRHNWLTEPATLPLGADGSAVISFVPRAAGEFVKVWPGTDRSLAKDSARVPAVVQPPVPPVTPPSGQAAISAVEGAVPVAGQPNTVTVRSSGVATLEWVAIRNDPPRYSWQGEPVSVAASPDGVTKITWTPGSDTAAIKVMALGNRAVTATGPMAVAPVVVPGPAPTGDAGFAQAWMRGLKHGLNVERWRPVYMTYNGARLNGGPQYWDYLRTIEVTHVRGFFPCHGEVDMLGRGTTAQYVPDDGAIREFFEPWRWAIRSGIKVHLDALDVHNARELHDGRYGACMDYLERFARIAATIPEFTPEMIAIGPCNELAGGQNGDFNEWRMEGHRRMRLGAPRHIIVHGAADWDSPSKLTAGDWQAPPDRLSMGQWHHYFDANSGIGFYQDWQNALADWSQRNGGIPSICGEAGFDEFWANHDHVDYSERWHRAVRDQAQGIPREAPVWWAVTDGRDYRCNIDPGNARIRPEVESLFRETAHFFDGVR